MNIQKKLETAIQFHQQGQFSEAEKIYRQVIKAKPTHPDAQHLFGLLLMQSGQAKAAIEPLLKAVKFNPQQADYHNSLGEAYRNSAQLEQAQQCYQTALRLNPNHPMVLNNLALVLTDLGQIEQALTLYQKAITIQPSYADGHFNYGTLLYAQQQFEPALEQLNLACRFNPRSTNFWQTLGNAERDAGNSELAVKAYQQVIALQPNHPQARNNLAVVLTHQGHFSKAVKQLKLLVANYPQLIEAHINLGNALYQLDQYSQAIEHFELVLQQQAHNLQALRGIGSCQRNLGEIKHAIASYQKALTVDPSDADSHFALAFTHLLAGDYALGWKEYEWRWKCGNSGSHRPTLTAPEWQGEPLAGKHIFVYCEQGAGDAIQFARFIPLLAQQGATVTLQCPSSLLSLLATIEGISQLIDTTTQPPECDLQVAIMSLPLHLNIGRNDLNGAAYLNIDKLPASSLAILPNDHFEVGICWSGNPNHANNHRRSAPATLLKHWQLAGIDLVSLQIQAADLDGEYLSEVAMLDLTEQINSYSDTAQLIRQLNLVITVDTSVAHLAGAMGKPVWLLLPYAPDWRWQLESLDSPWYDSMRLFRQPQPGDWKSVGEAVAEELKQLIGTD